MTDAAPRLSWRRVLASSACLALVAGLVVVATLLWQYQQSMVEQVRLLPRPRPANDATQVAIVRAISATEHSPLPPFPPLPDGLVQRLDPVERLPTGLLDRTISLRSCDPSRSSGAIRCDFGGGMGEQIESAEHSRFSLEWRKELVRASLTPMAMPDPRVDGVVLVAKDSEAIGRLAGFSRAVLSQDGRAALIYFETHSHGLGAACILFRLVHTPAGWQVDEREWHCVG